MKLTEFVVWHLFHFILHLLDTAYFKAPRQIVYCCHHICKLINCLPENVFCSKATEIDNFLHKKIWKKYLSDKVILTKSRTKVKIECEFL